LVSGRGIGFVGLGRWRKISGSGTIFAAGLAAGIVFAGWIICGNFCRKTLPSRGTLVATPGRRYSSGAIRTTLGSARAFNEVGIIALSELLGLLEKQA
jgi:hypothetical protein